MAAPTGDLCEWGDVKMVKAAFRRGVRKASGGKKLTMAEASCGSLTALKTVVPKAAYEKLNTGVYAGAKKDAKGKLSIETFATKEFFWKMASKDEELAKKWFQEMAEAESKRLEEEKSASADAAKKGTDVTSRLTDTSKYTGSSKERFDRSGQGKGIAGRKDMHKNDGYVGDYKGAGSFEKKKATDSPSKAVDDVTKRLTDTKLYTASHKERFDEEGKGKGISGRKNTEENNTGYVANYKGEGTYQK